MTTGNLELEPVRFVVHASLTFMTNSSLIISSPEILIPAFVVQNAAPTANDFARSAVISAGSRQGLNSFVALIYRVFIGGSLVTRRRTLPEARDSELDDLLILDRNNLRSKSS